MLFLAKNSFSWSLIDKVKVSCMQMDKLMFWQLEQKPDFFVRYNFVGQVSDNANQQSCFYLDAIPKTLI